MKIEYTKKGKAFTGIPRDGMFDGITFESIDEASFEDDFCLAKVKLGKYSEAYILIPKNGFNTINCTTYEKKVDEN